MADHRQRRWTSFELDCIYDIEHQQATQTDGSATSGTLTSPSFSTTQDSEDSMPNPDTSLWDGFENCAYSVAKLYREASWRSFQKAAQATTQFYKDSTDANRRSLEQGMALGRQKLLKEIIGYLKCSNRSATFIRREDLLAFLAGKSPPVRHLSSFSSSPMLRTMDSLHLQSSSTSCYNLNGETESPDTSAICMFREALALESAGSSPVFSGSPRSSPPRRVPELSAFLAAECRKHRKRRTDRESTATTYNKRRRL